METIGPMSESVWYCSSCGRSAPPSQMDTRWRWTGTAYEHKCASGDPQAGYFGCRVVSDLVSCWDTQSGRQSGNSQPSPRTGHPDFYRILGEMEALHEKKSADYGLGKDTLANVRASEDFGIPAWVGAALRMNDKMIRLKAFAQKGSLQNESVEDSLQDIAAYAIIALILYREVKPKPRSLAHTEDMVKETLKEMGSMTCTEVSADLVDAHFRLRAFGNLAKEKKAGEK